MSWKSQTCMSKRTGEPLTAFEYEYEAESAAEFSNTAYDNDLTPYQCHQCTQWHLTPKSHYTPSETCSYCTDREGGNKQLYKTELAAVKRATIISREKHIHLRVYECPYQSGWHLTKGQ